MRVTVSVFFCLVFSGSIARAEAVDALDEVNAARAARGLRPYVRDANLTAGALNAAKFRAERLIAGHTSNDFSALPAGVSASAAGCAAWHPSWGWGSCATFENHMYAGAAWAFGRDGRRYMHLFVNGSIVSQTERISSYENSRVSYRPGPVRRRR